MISGIADHLWQSTLFAGVAGVVTLALRKNRAQVRYWVWFAASVKFLAPFAVLAGLGALVPLRHDAAVPVVRTEWVKTVEQIGEPLVVLPVGPRIVEGARTSYVPILLGLWVCGFLGILMRWGRRWARIRADVRMARPMELGLPIPVRSSAAMFEPGVFGVLRPVLLLPEGIGERLSREQLNAIVAHELCHVRRRDNLTAAMHMFVQALFWFHPLVWWIGARLIDERERACDEEVLRLGSAPGVYAEGILNVCRLYVESPVACVAGVTGSDLKKRVEAIMRNRNLLRLSFAKKAALAVVGVVAVAVPILVGVARAQTPLKSFEVASVRLADPRAPGGRGGMPPTLTGSRFEYVATIHSLVVRAYGLPGCHQDDCDFVVGGPSWIKNDMYRIEAKLPEGTPVYNFNDFDSGQAEGVYQMIQSLLMERFGLKVHREAKEVPVYALTVGPGGHKLTTTAGKMRQYADGTTRLDRRSAMMPIPGPGLDGAQRVSMSVTNFTLQEFAESLSNQFDRPVLDHTGVSGRFDFSIEFDADPPDPGSIRPKIGGPGLTTALSQRLGLRLEATKAPIDVLAIDSIQRPSEN